MNERLPIVVIDGEIFQQLLTYGFEAEEARAALLLNDNNIMCSFYHLLLERRDRLMAHQSHVDGLIGTSPNPSVSPLGDAMEVDSVGTGSVRTHSRSNSGVGAAVGPQALRMVRDVETGEMVQISQVDRNVRRAIRQNSQFQAQQKQTA